jgi:uncharacterized membrane-anchored protein YjiN (DUF445 family)
MRVVATSLLVVAAVVFVVASGLEDEHGWAGYVRATAEAAMVGAVADWFAVTALFRHPLGLPIPHTAIVQRRKDQIGASLGTFVRDNFLTREVVTGRLAQANIAPRLGHWLEQPANARSVGDQSAAVVRGLTEVLRDDTVQHGIEQLVTSRARAIPVSPLVGRALDVAIAGGHHQALVNSTLLAIADFLDDNREQFRQRIRQESPWWVPGVVDDRVLEKIYEVAHRFMHELHADPEHPLRQDFDARVRLLAERLKTSPEMLAKGEALKEELLAHPDVRAWVASLWARLKQALLDATEDPSSELRVRLDEALVAAGRRLSSDPALQSKVDHWIEGAVSYVAEQFRSEVAELISHTVERWDGVETSRRIELQVGRDLQFIRINGTIVGGLVGLLIYTFAELVL